MSTEVQKRIGRPPSHDYALEVSQRFKSSLGLIRMSALDGSTGEPRKNWHVLEGGIAVIHVSGCLMNGGACWWDETNYQEIRDEVAIAKNDQAIKGVLLLVNSPGGECEMAYETADEIADLAKVKPVYGVADAIAYSAGFLLISQCTRIYVPKTSGGVGSIGVYMAHWDMTKALEKMGIAVTLFSAGDGKLAGHPLNELTDEAGQSFITEVNRLYAEFVSRVASGRAKSESEIIKLGAWLFEGSERSLGAGLSDRVGSPDDALADLAQEINKPIVFSPSRADTSRKKGVLSMTDEETKAAELEAARTTATAAGRKEGAAAANTRAATIMSACNLAKMPELSAGFVASEKSIDQIMGELDEKRAAKEKEEATAGAGGGKNITSTITGRESTDTSRTFSLSERAKQRVAAMPTKGAA